MSDQKAKRTSRERARGAGATCMTPCGVRAELASLRAATLLGFVVVSWMGNRAEFLGQTS